MAKAKNPLAGKINKALANHAQDETTYSQEFIDLPPGIQGGVATLVDAKLGVYQSGDNEGKQFLYLAGVVVEPVEHTYNPKIFINGKVETQEAVTVKVQGQRTSLMIPWCDTTNSKGEVTTVDDHINDSMNRLRQLGADTSGAKTEGDLEALLGALTEVKPLFKFGTRASKPSAQYPEPRTWESWYGSEGLEDYEAPDEDEVIDETEEPDTVPFEPEEGEGEPTEAENADLGELADAEEEAGDDEKQDARNQLTKLAEDAGVDPDEFTSWSDVVDAINEAKGGAEDEDEGDDNPPPEEGEVWEYKPPRKQNFLDVQVVAVFPRKNTVNIKNLEDGKTVYKNIPWDKLRLPEED